MSKKQRTVLVETFGRHGTVQLNVSSSANVKEIFSTLCKQLKLKNTSEQHFSLYCGPLGQPKVRLTDGEDQQYSNLCLQRCGVEPFPKELKAIKTDDVALHLLYSEASFYFNQPITKLKPTQEQRELLEEYSDPQFPTERQFLETALNVKGYVAIQATSCTLKVHLQHRNVSLPADATVICTCYEDVLEILDEASENVMQWDWKAVKKWKLSDENEACFEVLNEMGNASILEWLIIQTEQAPLLLQSAHQICTHILHTLCPELKPDNQVRPHLPGRFYDPLHEYLNTSLFGPEIEFSSIN